MSALREPVPFEVYGAGVYLHGTKAELAVGDPLAPGLESNFETGRVMSYVYFSATLDAAVWGAELASGEGRGRRLHVFVQQLTRDAPAPAGVTAPDHEEASSYPWGIRALRPTHPVPMSLRCCEVACADGRVGNDLHRGDDDRGCEVKKRVPSLDRRHSGSDEDRILRVVVNPGRRV